MKPTHARIVVLITCANREEADKISSSLVEQRLVACVNIIDAIHSVFWWQGKVDNAKETLLIAKSRKEKMNDIIKTVKSLHNYEVPEIIALPILAGNKEYLDWLDESVAKSL